jgi:hypothetical protein
VAYPTGKRFYVGNPVISAPIPSAVADDIDLGNLDFSLGYRFTREYIKEFGGFNIEGTAGNLFSVKVHDEWSDPLHTVNLDHHMQLMTPANCLAISHGRARIRAGNAYSRLKRPGAEDRIKIDLDSDRI